MEGAELLIAKSYATQALEARKEREKMIRSLLAQRSLPPTGWSEDLIEELLGTLASMDSNNFVHNVGVGEREARVYSGIVARRHFRMAHGVGRSGDLVADQPKAAGATLLFKLANALCLNAIRTCCGVRAADKCLITPLATGMTMTLVLLALRQQQQKKPPETAKYVIWPRIDQKSCLKAIVTAEFVPVVVEGKTGATDEVRITVEDIEKAVHERCGGPENVFCVLSTTSCFAPRVPDDVVGIALLCEKLGIAHVINNAYGLQASKITHAVDEAMRRGRVDAVVQSTDKNFLVPVGGGIVLCDSKKHDAVDLVSKAYPGRASSVPAEDVFVTLLEMGQTGLKDLLRERKDLMPYFTEKVARVCAENNERLLVTPDNPISFGVTLDNHAAKDHDLFMGSMLFTRGCSGTRVYVSGPQNEKIVCGIKFDGFGAHCAEYPHSYMSIACAIGITKKDIDTFCERLEKTFKEYDKKFSKKVAKEQQQQQQETQHQKSLSSVTTQEEQKPVSQDPQEENTERKNVD